MQYSRQDGKRGLMNYVRIHVVLTSSDIRLCSFWLHLGPTEPNFDRNVPSTFRRVGGWGRGLRGLGRIEGQMIILLGKTSGAVENNSQETPK